MNCQSLFLFLRNIALLSLAGLCIGLSTLFNPHALLSELLSYSEWIFLLSAVSYLLLSGTFIKSRYFRLCGAGMSVLLIGVMFKIMHWPMAFLLLTSGFFLMALFYTLHFWAKLRKRASDYFKLLFLYALLTWKMFQFSHFPHIHPLFLVTYCSLALAFLLTPKRQ